MDAVSISVPTPLRKTRDPDLSHVVAAAEDLAAHIHPGMLVILESTTYPGTTEEAILPLLEKSGLKVGRDFFLCFSPERVDPGNKHFHTRNIPKVIGGVTPACTEIGALFYSQFMEQVVPVSSTRVAEMVKLMENTFRMINIALANEMALMCDHMNIDVWEVIEAAATKPFGFMPFYPGPGLGGHCIPVDPLYLSWKTRQTGHEARLIDLAAQINIQMPRFVVDKVQAALNDRAKPVKGSRIHIVGVAYKRDVSDVRESPALDIIKLLAERGGEVSYTDPLVPRIEIESRVWESQPLDAAAKAADCVWWWPIILRSTTTACSRTQICWSTRATVYKGVCERQDRAAVVHCPLVGASSLYDGVTKTPHGQRAVKKWGQSTSRLPIPLKLALVVLGAWDSPHFFTARCPCGDRGHPLSSGV